MKHICEAPICVCHTGNEVWYPGEKVCNKTPYSKFQRKQIDINKWHKLGKFKKSDVCYTKRELEGRLI